MYVQLSVGFEWDEAKARSNFRKHGVRFDESRAVFDDPYAITIADEHMNPPEQRFVGIGLGALGRVLVVVYAYRGDNFRVISVRVAAPHERAAYEAELP